MFRKGRFHRQCLSQRLPFDSLNSVKSISSYRIAALLLSFLTSVVLSGCIDEGDLVPPEDEQKADQADSQKESLVPKTKSAGPVENIEADERIAAARLIEAHDAAAHEIKIFDAEIRGAFDEERFAFLEETGHKLRESKELCADGSWKIFRFYEGIDNRFHWGDDGFLTDLEIHRKWEKAFPDSLTRRVALAEMLVSYAWHARGTGYAHTVTPEGWRLMRERLEQASAVLVDARGLSDSDPYWFSAAMTVGTGQSWDKEMFDKLVEECRSKYPGYWHLETQRAYTLLPRWFGDEGDWEKFALEAAKVPKGLGAETYARIIIRMSGYDVADVFRDSDAEWSRMKPGLQTLLEKYPESVTLKNEAAYHATLGRDREMAGSIFKSLGDEYIQSVWQKPERFVHFRTYAMTGKW